MGRKENLPVWGKYDRLYGVVQMALIVALDAIAKSKRL